MSAARKIKAEPVNANVMTPEREALAAAIKAKVQHDDELAGARTGLQKLDAQSLEVSRALREAKERLQTAQTAAVAYASDIAVGKSPALPISLRDARAAALEAEDDHAARKRAREALFARKQVLDGIEFNGGKKLAVITAARAVLKAEVDAQSLSADIRALQDRLIQKRLVLCFLRGELVVPSEGSPDGDWALPTTQCMWPEILPIEWRTDPSPDWRSVFEALCEDASTVLPALDQ